MSIFSRIARGVFAAVAATLLFSFPASAQVNVTTQRYDNGRTGSNLNELILNTSNVNATQFGKLFSYTVDGSVYAQPLYLANVAIPGQGTHNVLYVVTQNDVLYAFDADTNTGTNGGLLWQVDYKNPGAGVTSIPITDIVNSNTLNIVGTVGIESTPVIDASTNTMYFVARTKEVSGAITSYVARLHAVDVATGAEKFNGPTVIQGQVPGNGNGSSGGVLKFDPFIQNQRSALALVNGTIVFSWASHEDFYAWHGWVMAYSASTLQQTGIYCTSAFGMGSGSWMGGRGPAVDGNGNVYYMTGNGDWNGTTDLGDSIIKLSTAGGALTVADYFTPDNYVALQNADEDLGSGGPLLIPGTDYLIGGGKQSLLYLMHTANMGHEQTGNGQIPQLLPSGNGGYFTGGGPTFWNRTTGAGPTMYFWTDSSAANLSAYRWNGSTFDTTPLTKSTMTAASGFATGAALTISANGSTPGTGIVWASMPTSSAGHGTAPGLLRAFDANNLATELWDSTLNASRDNTGTWAKFVPPTVVNGKVYAASFSNTLSVFGLLSSAANFTIAATPGTQTVGSGASTTYTVNVGALNGFAGQVALSVTGLPSGATSSFSSSSIGGGGTSTLTVNTASSTPVGTSTLTITGTSGSLTHSAGVSLVVSNGTDFNVTATPTTASVSQGNTAVYTATATALNGFSNVVTWSLGGLPTGATASFSPTSVTGTGSSTLSVTTTATTAIGTYPLTVTGTSGAQTHVASVSLTITGSTGSTAKAISIHFVGNGVPMGAGESAGVIAKGNWNNANGAGSTAALSLLDESGSTSGATATWKADNTWVTSITDQAGNFRMMEGYLDTGKGNTTTVTVSGLPTNTTGYNVYVYADGDNPNANRTGIYQIAGAGITTTSINLTDKVATDFNGTFTQANNSNGNYVVFTIGTTGFTLSAIPGAAGDGFQRAPLNAIEIMPIGPASPDFSLTATPGSATTPQGGSAGYTVNVGALNGFSGSASLRVSGLPTGASASFVPGTVAAGSSSAMTVTTAATTPAGGYTLTITGTSGSLVHTATVTLVVTGAPDFSIGATPPSLVASQGNNAVYTVTTTALNSFSGVVTLSAGGLPTGATAAFNPSSIAGGGSSALTVTTATSTPVGVVTLTITGTSGALTHSTTVSLNVVAQGSSTAKAIGINFVGTGNPMAASELAGVITKGNWNNATGASSTNALGLQDESGSATTAAATWSSDNTWVVPGTDTAGNLRLMRGYLDTGNGNTSTVTVTGLPANASGYNVYVYADGDNGAITRTGVYQISGAGITTSSISLTDNANANFGGTFTQANNSNGNYVLFTVNASGFTISAIPGTAADGHQRAPLNGIQIVPVGAPVADFTIAANPGSASAVQGAGATYTVSATALNGFTGAVGLTASGLPAGATAAFNPAAINGGGSSTLTITTAANTPVGNSTVTVTGTNGSLSHAATVTLVVTGPPDFSVAATPGSATVGQGSNTSYTTSVTGLSGFAGTVTLTASGLPAGATASFSPATIGSGASSTLTVATTATTPTGSSTLTITGTSGTLTHSASVTLTVTSVSTGGAKTISIDFLGNGIPMAASETAGVVAKTNWNVLSGGSNSTPLGLVDETGSATSAAITWNSNGTWVTPITDQPGNTRMMEGYIDASTSNSTVNISGLPGNVNGYTVYVYADGDDPNGNRSAIYQISGSGVTTTSVTLIDAGATNFSGTFTQANNSKGNYVVFTVNASAFTLTAIPSTAADGFQRAPLNGIQIVPR